MSKKNLVLSKENENNLLFKPGVEETRKTLQTWLPWLYLLISSAFYLRTYDSAQVKITLVQMGGITLMGLWLSLLFSEGKKAFKKDDFVFLSPFLAYLAYVWISFFHAPYKGPSVDDLIRYTIYMSVSLIVIREFDKKAIDRLTKILTWTAYIAVGYGFLQLIDTRFFPPPREGSGIDPFIWRWAFGQRVFSTYGNPNFFGNFLVLIFPILLSQYLKTKSFFYLPVIILDALCVYFTYTKGAWIGFSITLVVFAAIYIYFFTKIDKNKILKTYAALVMIAVLAVISVVIYAKKTSMTSVPFRVATWLSTWEMIETHPAVGTGTGVFKVIYPAFRRPVIFHLEGKHNTETDHAENEHLEQMMDHGVLGAGIFYWIIAFVVFIALKALKFNTEDIKNKKPSLSAYDILGYLTAFLGMLIHNFTDVSMRFVSSGVYLGLLPAVIINLARGHALWEFHYMEESQIQEKETDVKKGLLAIVKAAVSASVLFFSYKIFTEFSVLQGALSSYSYSGEILQWILSWGVFILVCAYLIYRLYLIIISGYSIIAVAVIAIMLWPLYYFWGWFKADVHHNMAIYFSKRAEWENALANYRKVNENNKYFIMPYYFMGNVFNDRFNMEKTYNPNLGDKNGEPRNDFERAMERYETLRAMAPNYVQMHHQVGNLYMKMYDYHMKRGEKELALPYLDKAMARYDLYQNIDPVFPYNYYRRAQIWLIKGEKEKAEKEYLNNINAWKCHREGHKHESAEAYANLANFYYMTGRNKDAAFYFSKALEIDPSFQPARNALNFLTGKK
ncbi:MAG: tetratricopeptide repeat protein [Elusimicrobia bacterium]|nr:tetratricopeptide repeat protein [Elusimicrobiota bacterium]